VRVRARVVPPAERVVWGLRLQETYDRSDIADHVTDQHRRFRIPNTHLSPRGSPGVRQYVLQSTVVTSPVQRSVAAHTQLSVTRPAEAPAQNQETMTETLEPLASAAEKTRSKPDEADAGRPAWTPLRVVLHSAAGTGSDSRPIGTDDPDRERLNQSSLGRGRSLMGHFMADRPAL